MHGHGQSRSVVLLHKGLALLWGKSTISASESGESTCSHLATDGTSRTGICSSRACADGVRLAGTKNNAMGERAKRNSTNGDRWERGNTGRRREGEGDGRMHVRVTAIQTQRIEE